MQHLAVVLYLRLLLLLLQLLLLLLLEETKQRRSNVVAEGQECFLVRQTCSSGRKTLNVSRIRGPVRVHQKGRRHEVRWQLRLLVHDIVVGVSD